MVILSLQLLFVSLLILTNVIAFVPETPGDIWTKLWSLKPKNDYSLLSGKDIIPESDLSHKNRTIWIITTASLPWMTGTAVNPLLRAAYLTRGRPEGKIFLVVPWIPIEDQNLIYPTGIRFNSSEEQLAYIRNWLKSEAGLHDAADRLNIVFYNGRYHDEFHSIFPLGDITSLIPDEKADVCILEEPEHLNWFKAPFTAKTWMDKFPHVVGIIHTNYIMYLKSDTRRQLTWPFLYVINQGMCRAYCNKIIKLSDALQPFAVEKEVVCNVHGTREKYLEIGAELRPRTLKKGAYFIGKLAWPKGFKELFDLMMYLRQRTGKSFSIDIFGQGPHADEIKEMASRHRLPVHFRGPQDHANLIQHKVFVNPSLSEVLCTTNLEALAMGKWLICPKHSSNEFFEKFPNCLTYCNKEEFSAKMNWALSNDPLPLSAELRRTLTWEDAINRLISASVITKEMAQKSNNFSDKFIGWVFQLFGSGKHGDLIRMLAGGKNAANQIEYLNLYGSSTPISLSEEEKTAFQSSLDDLMAKVQSAVQSFFNE